MLRRVGVDIARLLRTGGLAGAQYGQAAIGISDYSLMQLRRTAAGFIGGAAKGKDPNLTLIAADAKMGDRADPAFTAHADVVVQWALAIWEGLLPLAMMQRSVLKAKADLVRAKRQWAVVKGPAAALIATVARVGWTVVDATLAYDDLGEEIAFTKDSPAAVKQKVHESVRRWRWRMAGLAGKETAGGDVCEGPVWKPVADLLAKGRWHDPGENEGERAVIEQLTKGEQGALRSAVVGGQWPQYRLCVAGLADVPWCALCLWHGILKVGHLLHRIYECPYVQGRASATMPHEVQAKWAARSKGGRGGLGHGEMAMEWERGLVLEQKVGRRPPQETFRWVSEPSEMFGNVNVYMDGSMYDGFDDRLAVFGWAFVIVKEGKVVGSARGNPPPHVRSIPAAEAWALAMAVGHADVATSRFLTDCKSVRDTARAGMKRATAAGKIHARTWNITFARTDGEKPNVEWIPAHLTESHVGVATIGDGTKLTREQWVMNMIVDEYAKAAAKEVRRPREEVQGVLRRMRQVAIGAAWIARAMHVANNGGGGAPA